MNLKTLYLEHYFPEVNGISCFIQGMNSVVHTERFAK